MVTQPFNGAEVKEFLIFGSIVDFVNYLEGSSLTSEGDLVISRFGFNSIFLLKGSYLPTSLVWDVTVVRAGLWSF